MTLPLCTGGICSVHISDGTHRAAVGVSRCVSHPIYCKRDRCSGFNQFALYEMKIHGHHLCSIFLCLRFNDRKPLQLSTLNELPNKKSFMLSVCKMDLINIILYMLPWSHAECLKCVMIEFASAAVKLNLDASWPQAP